MLQAQEATRLPDLLPLRHARMLASRFAFYRGAAAIMAADLASTPDSGIRVQCCGDAHLANFGAYESPERSLVFDINDFDETITGPWEWDVKRLPPASSSRRRTSGTTSGRRARRWRAPCAGYRQAMRTSHDNGRSRSGTPGSTGRR